MVQYFPSELTRWETHGPSSHSSLSSTKYCKRTKASSKPLTEKARLVRSRKNFSVGASRTTSKRSLCFMFGPMVMSLATTSAVTNCRSHAFVSPYRAKPDLIWLGLFSFLGKRQTIVLFWITQRPGSVDLNRLMRFVGRLRRFRWGALRVCRRFSGRFFRRAMPLNQRSLPQFLVQCKA